MLFRSVLVAGGAYWFMRSSDTPANTTPKAVTATEAPIDKPAATINLPPLDQMDAYLRPLLQALSARPELVRWLATDDLIGQLAFAIDEAASGATPARNFKVVAPIKPFATAGRGTRRTIDPKSYGRYDSLVLTVTSIDASRVAQVYKTIKPRLNEAYQKNGHPNGNVDRAVQQALDILLATPVVKDPIALVEGDGARGQRPADIPEFANIQIEVIVPPEVAAALLDRLGRDFFPRYGMVAFESDVRVLRREKFGGGKRDESPPSLVP